MLRFVQCRVLLKLLLSPDIRRQIKVNTIVIFFFQTHHAALIRELSSQTLEEKFNIYARPCVILYST